MTRRQMYQRGEDQNKPSGFWGMLKSVTSSPSGSESILSHSLGLRHSQSMATSFRILKIAVSLYAYTHVLSISGTEFSLYVNMILFLVKHPSPVRVCSYWSSSVTNGTRLYQDLACKTAFAVIFKCMCVCVCVQCAFTCIYMILNNLELIAFFSIWVRL